MADVVLTKQKIEPGKTPRLKEWMDEIRGREDEAIQTLKNEGVYAESAFIERTDDGEYLVYYMEAEDMGHVFEAFSESSHEIDLEHQEVMSDVLETEENVGEYELLYHLVNPERPE